MTHKEKVEYLRIALSLQKIGIDEQTSDVVVSTFEKILTLGGKFNIKDAIDIQISIERKYAKIKLEKQKNTRSNQ